MKGKSKKTIIFTHGDSDGICSGSIAKSAYPDADVFFTSPVSLSRRLDMAKGYDNVIICDIAVDERECFTLYQKLDAIATTSDVVYIDHHPLPKQCWDAPWFHHNLDVCAAELTYKVFESRLSRDIRRVAIYGAIGDYCDHTPDVKKWTKDWDKRSLYYQAGTLIQAIQYAGRNYDFKRSLLVPLSKDKIPSEIAKLPKYARAASRLEEELRIRVKATVQSLSSLAYVIDPDGFLGKSAIYAASYGRRNIGVAAEHRENKGAYDLSLRSRNGADINRILREVAPMYGGSGGGHSVAAGARIPEESFESFILELDRRIEMEDKKAAEA
ncbi:RecJ-like exonuclease [Methanohalophilus levihalophilus]|uniref:DHHA1 domain-containing protein n=1 Tax=Methanohalophilus levihalophilus TaxID=1431282 RepID=UPI001AE794D9|nr:DHHA1 domain-containing protein [Methanohalophilus levihalophilus]MBP2029696.1 RecJ-like exonuclease [Methanohalophilus levihalophilus]